MSFFDKLKKSKGGYIFLSHSHEDIAKVREIRNSLEKDGFEPLCFYLKCLNDDSEIEDLIKREIDAREWFVFVNSENSRKSKWVTLEREYITKTNTKKIITVDIDDDNSISETIQKITKNLRVYISYSSEDEVIARKIKDKLMARDYLVFFAPDSVPAGIKYAAFVVNAISEAAKDGCVMVLLTPDAMESPWVTNEVEKAIMEKGTVFPVTIGDVELTPTFKYYLSKTQFYKLSESPTDEEIDQMIEFLGRSILKK